MMMGIDDIRKEVYRLGKIIDAPINLLILPDHSTNDGTPHVEILNDEYHYVLSERGIESERKITTELSELLYWIFSNITLSMSYSYELNNRLPNEDSRRLVFSKQIDLMGKLFREWSMREKKRIEKILEKIPYDDFIEKRVSFCKELVSKGYSNEEAYEESCIKYPIP